MVSGPKDLVVMTREQLINRLLADNPSLYVFSDDDLKRCDAALREVGIEMKPGLLNMAPPVPHVFRYFLEKVQKDHYTLETGAGQTTIALAALAKHHTCVTKDERPVPLIKEYMAKAGIPEERVTFVLDSSDKALPGLRLANKLDFVYIDGCHGYPFPSLDWHFIDEHLNVGGIAGFDNTEIIAVGDHCRFLDQDKSYELIDSFCFGDMYGVNFYRKLAEEDREWIFQAQNHRRIPYYKRYPVARNVLHLYDRPSGLTKLKSALEGVVQKFSL